MSHGQYHGRGVALPPGRSCHSPAPWGRVSPDSPDVGTIMRGGITGGRKGVRAAGSVQAFFKITPHHWYCSQNGSLSFLLFQSFFGSTTTSSSNRLLVLAFATCGTSSHLSLTAVRNINQLPKTFFLVNKSLLER